MVILGVPYTQFELDKAVYLLKNQAKKIENNLRQDPEFVKNYGDANIKDKEIVALIAYLQRLGTDIKAKTAQN
jgi:cytochrome c oxidase cbb3-type subunit I/II